MIKEENLEITITMFSRVLIQRLLENFLNVDIIHFTDALACVAIIYVSLLRAFSLLIGPFLG